MAIKKEVTKVTKVTKAVKASKADSGQAGMTMTVSKAPIARGTRDTSKTRGTLLSVPLYSLSGTAAGSLELPKELFGEKVNTKLLTMAMRIYLNNQKSHHSHTKTRGEVKGSTRKIYKQKGTGRARHGAITAPIFVGGGIALGPKSRKTVLELPKKMKRSALISALSQKASEQKIVGVSNLDKSTGKTKEMVGLLSKLLASSSQPSDNKAPKTLIVCGEKMENAARSSRNIAGLSFQTADQINAFEIIKHQNIILTKEAIGLLLKRVNGEMKGDN